MIEAVRPARPGDGVTLAALEADARSALQDQRGGPERLAEVGPVGATEWERRLTAAEWIVLIATIDEYPVGFLSGVVETDRLEIEAVWVDEGARELGFGDGLLLEALQRARDRGAIVAEAVALPGDRATKNLFERFGMKARKLVVSRRIVDFP